MPSIGNLYDSREALPIFLADITNIVKKLHSGKEPGVDEMCPDMLCLGFVGCPHTEMS